MDNTLSFISFRFYVGVDVIKKRGFLEETKSTDLDDKKVFANSA